MPTAQPHKKSLLNSEIVYLILILAFSIYICWPLFKENFIDTVDGGDHLLRLYCMNLFMGKGQWFVRWIPYLHGYGYPEFNFYPPLIAIAGTVFLKTGISIIWALNLTCFLFFFLSGVTMYLFAKELWGAHGGFLSAVAYLFVPYQMVDLYTRGDYSESASFAFLPLILWGFLKLRKELNVSSLLIAALSIAGLFLTNNCITLIFFPVIFFYILVLHFPLHRQNYLSLMISLAALGLGIGLAAFYWLPALLEKDFVHIQKMTNGDLNFHKCFLSIQQLVFTKPTEIYRMEIGLVQGILAITSICFIQRITKNSKFLIKQLVFFFFVFILAILFALPVSVRVWEHIHILQLIQFPGRFLMIISLMVSILAGGVCLISAKHRRTILILGVSAIFLMNFSHCRPTYGSSKVNLTNIPPSFVFRFLHTQDGGEFIPKWVKVIRTPTPFDSLEIIKGKGRILSHHEFPEVHQTFTLEALSPSLLCFNVFYFPGWTIKVDGHLVDILKDNPYGLIIFPVNKGVHEIKADFGLTPVRLAASIISFISLLILLSLLFLRIYSFLKPKHVTS